MTMRYIIQSWLISIFLVFPLIINAQGRFDKVFLKYNGKPGFISVRVSNDMFHLFASMTEVKDSNSAEMRQIMNRLTGLTALVCNIDSTSPACAAAFLAEATAAFPGPVYKDLMTVENEGEHIRFLTRQDAAGNILELVMLIKDTEQNIAMSITGAIDLATISRLSKAMDIKGMENLNELKSPRSRK